ncbi:YdaU family protein [Paenalcaligenes suwonensis]|uniref:YdaU family protein n=1 Tax=Paenalcaligenes suwonensis TaxID=1202713 RepID=UPI00140E912D|nr:YdaU family protein [Paenalcaligenes suwonensis]NHC63193.1 YdaU family protein [Paenalcaligenes suwonensis]
MNHYSHHIGDYLKDTAHLSMIEDGAYRRLLDLYYQHEQPLPAEKRQVYRLARASTAAEKKAIDTILEEFFQKTIDGHRHSRCDEEIEQYQLINEDNEAKKENEKERQRRHRERRKLLFAMLREFDVVPAWDAKTTDLETLLKQYQSRVTGRDNNVADTGTATAIHYPLPITHNKEEAAYIPTEGLGAQESPPAGSENNPDDQPSRNALIAVLLRKHGADPATHAGSKGISAMIDLQATDEHILAALETAKTRRKDTNNPQPVNAAYLVPIIADLQKPQAEKPDQKPRDEWYRTEPGIDRKARELGMFARAGESYNEFKDRMFQEIKRREREQQGATV